MLGSKLVQKSCYFSFSIRSFVNVLGGGNLWMEFVVVDIYLCRSLTNGNMYAVENIISVR